MISGAVDSVRQGGQMPPPLNFESSYGPNIGGVRFFTPLKSEYDIMNKNLESKNFQKSLL